MQIALPFEDHARNPETTLGHPASGTAHPAPGTQHPAPGTQHPAPGTQHPAPGTQHPAPGTAHPALSTQHPAPVLEFTRHPRARRYVLRLTDEGTVRVTIPRWGSKREAQEFAQRERAWIEKQRRRLRGERRPGPEAQPGPEEGGRELRERAKRELPPRLLALAAQHGIAAGAVRKISVRNQKWRWGSCSPDGHICLNWRLVQMPDAVRDYVLVHELMHLKRMDHSAAFWKLVAQACPDYRELRRYLRTVRR